MVESAALFSLRAVLLLPRLTCLPEKKRRLHFDSRQLRAGCWFIIQKKEGRESYLWSAVFFDRRAYRSQFTWTWLQFFLFSFFPNHIKRRICAYERASKWTSVRACIHTCLLSVLHCVRVQRRVSVHVCSFMRVTRLTCQFVHPCIST